MPGANCAFPDCGTTRRESFAGVAIFQVPNRNTEFYLQWRKNILNVLLKFRSVDTLLKKRIDCGKVYVCEKHFSADDIEFTSKRLFFFKIYYNDQIVN